MAVTPDLVRELVSRVESDALDFKLAQYDWTQDGNNELAKDLMAMANTLGPNDRPAYILIGVSERSDKTGEIVGVPPSAHLGDADMQQKVQRLLNRQPRFSYAPVEVDGLSVGVFEITPGNRPIYALRDAGTRHRLVRYQAQVRKGSGTDAASPDEIQQWATVDDPIAREIARVDLEAKLAPLVPKVHLTALTRPVVGTYGTDDEHMTQEFRLFNRGSGDVVVRELRCVWHLSEPLVKALKELQPDATLPDGLEIRLPQSIEPPRMIRPGSECDFRPTISRSTARKIVERVTGIAMSGDEWIYWLSGRVEFECLGPSERPVVVGGEFGVPFRS